MIPLPTLLSHTLVAWTIELDNEFELRMPHCTTASLKRGEPLQGPWLVSFAMYVHCMRHVTGAGISQAELERRARVLGPVLGLTRWGYLTVTQAPREGKRKADPRAATVRPTAAGLAAQNYWRPLPDEIDARWEERLGPEPLKALRDALVRVVAHTDPVLPDFLPVLHYGAGLLNLLPGDEQVPARHQPPQPLVPEPRPDPTTLPFYSLLSRALLAFAREYEREAELSLALGANLVRVLDDSGVPVAALPRMVGVSKEAISNSLTLQKRGYLVVEKVPGGRAKQARLTATGLAAQQQHHALVSEIESRWVKRFGTSVEDLRSALEAIVVSTDLADSPLAASYGPPPGTWRADMKTPVTLPHYPLVLHRGGYPDGA